MECDKCNNPATVHYQTCDLKWKVVNGEVDTDSQEFLFGEDPEYLCDEHDYK